MKKIIIILHLLVLFNLHIRVLANVKVPADTEIILVPIEKVISRNTKSKIKLKIKEDVQIDNTVIFKNGDKAFLKVVDYEQADLVGKPGSMEILNGYVYDSKGNMHEVLIDKRIVGKEQVWAQILFSLGFTIILFPLFLFGFVRGTNAKLEPKDELEVTLKEEFIY